MSEDSMANRKFSEKEEYLKWFEQSKFGLFIHWNPASVAGVDMSWARIAERPGFKIDGTDPDDIFARIPKDEYDALYKEFKPDNFDAEEWAKIAKEAGCKFLVFTTKHHDGFSMFDTKYSDYKITAKEAFGRDLTKELSDAVQKQGLKMGFYYSNPDWYHPAYLKENHDEYIDFMQNQLKELLTDYGDISILWFDGLWGGKPRHWDASKTYELIKSLQPNILVNDRLKHKGDFKAFERNINDFDMDMWASSQTLAGSWGWKPELTTKTLKKVIQLLVSIVGRGGNMILNVGPKADGSFEQSDIDRLKDIGQWLENNGASIYDTKAGPFYPEFWGVSTHRDKTIFLHLMNFNEDRLALPAMKNTITSVKIFGGDEIEFTQEEKGIRLKIPVEKQNRIDTIIEITVKEPIVEMADKNTKIQCSSLFESGIYGTEISQNAKFTLSSVDERHNKPNEGEFCSDKECSPYLTIDLGKKVKVTGMHAAIPKGKRPDDAELSVWLSDDGENWKYVWEDQGNRNEWSFLLKEFVTGEMTIGMNCRYVKLQAEFFKPDKLCLSSIKLFGEELH